MTLGQSLETYSREMERTLRAFQKAIQGGSLLPPHRQSRSGKIGFGLECLETPTQYVIIVQPLDPLNEAKFNKGRKLKIVDRIRNDARALDPATKSGNYSTHFLGYLEARADGFEDALFCNADGHLTEGSTYAFAYIKKRDLRHLSPRYRNSRQHHSQAHARDRRRHRNGNTRSAIPPRARLRSRRSDHDQHDLRILSRHPSRRSQDRKQENPAPTPENSGMATRSSCAPLRKPYTMTQHKLPLRQLENAAVSAALAAGKVLNKHFAKTDLHPRKRQCKPCHQCGRRSRRDFDQHSAQEIYRLRRARGRIRPPCALAISAAGSSIRWMARPTLFIDFRCSASQSRLNGTKKSSSG